ncbi:MAG: PTS sugar transporter subunit IIA [Deltaproteobacteria bacterium]|nr:PTS sugar transporter subunit IIA [Deltaproteobacteria bacterium]
MNIADILQKEYIIDDLRAKNKRDVLAELSALFLKAHRNLDHEAMLKALLDREKLGSTCIGEGMAIPHGKLGNLDHLVAAFGRSEEGIEFNALDGKPVHIFFLLIAPENSAGQHLKVLAKISRMLRDGGFRKQLLEAKSRDELYDAIRQKDETC